MLGAAICGQVMVSVRQRRKMSFERFILAIVVVATLGCRTAWAVTENYENGALWKDGVGPYMNVSYVLVKSTSSYDDALKFAQNLASRSSLPINLRGLIHAPDVGLTWPEEKCAADQLNPYPCYIARGRWDEGRYLSVERSDAYSSMKPGFYIVVAASGTPLEIAMELPPIQSLVPDAYSKTEEVYYGCMH